MANYKLFHVKINTMLPFLRRFRQARRRQQWLIGGGLLGLATLVLAVSAWASYRYFDNLSQNALITEELTMPDEAELDWNIELSESTDHNEDQLIVLLVGYGGAGHQGGFLADAIQIAHIDLVQQQLTFISIPRDLYLTDSRQQGAKINALLAAGMKQNAGIHGGLELMRQNLSHITGLPIQYYIGVDFVGFKRSVGYEFKGIEVEVAQTLDDPWYPIEGAQLDPCGYSEAEIAELTARHSGFALESKFACRYEHIYFPAGKHNMQGHEALAYVRSRHSSSDYDRSRRQVELMTAIKNKLFELETIKYLPKFYEAMIKHVQVNFDLAAAKQIAPLLLTARDFTIKNVVLSPENVLQSSKASSGAFILMPKSGMNNWQHMQQYIAAQLTSQQ